MRYVKVKFNEWDRRTYTYHHDGTEKIELGTRVVVITPSEGPKKAIVEDVTDQKPSFTTKPIDRVLVE